MHKTASSYIESLFELLEPNLIGFYNQFEVVTVFASSKAESQPFNILTVVVAQEEETKALQPETFLSPKPLKIKGVKDYSFGIVKYALNLDDTKDLLSNLSKDNVWGANQRFLAFSKNLELIPRIFVPADSTETVPLNNLLKNNFWSGSYVFEWFDTVKDKLKFFFDKPDLLQTLSEEINKFIPIKLASVSDRLGNLIIQLPVSIAITDVHHTKQGNALTLKIAWHPKASTENKNLIFNCIRLNDVTCQDFFSSRVDINTELIIPMEHVRGAHRYYLWDDDKKILLAASAESSFMHEISLNSAMIQHEPRGFYIKNNDSNRELIRLNVVRNHTYNINPDKNESKELSHTWITQRLYEHEKADLLNQKKLIQYNRNQSAKAYNDLRSLIQTYGQESIYLWDPYLAPQDILQTLFYCSHAHSALKAITELVSPPNHDSQVKKTLIMDYQQELEDSCENKFGLNLEFRAKIGKHGWSFHDRFIIFPKTINGPRAWSLGTSVNSLGKTHHIFQEVSDGRLIADAFEQLWVALDHQECLVWKC
ncbi:VPA1262 family N-terminal domain-containing protein [Acinetobacter oleivorans]|uniref:VPA1262 family N-terminal domain-containing protein n=1 Tax=Acinetobacter oleivorans TaxID=1148157 RepID=UPI003A8C15DB